jgi:hypothetical protein
MLIDRLGDFQVRYPELALCLAVACGYLVVTFS